MSNDIIIRDGDKVALAADVIQQIKVVDAAKKAAAKAESEMKEAIRAAMESNGVTRLDNEEAGLSIIYFPESETISFDEKSFCAEMPDLWAEYRTKKTKKKSYIKIATKEPKDGKAE